MRSSWFRWLLLGAFLVAVIWTIGLQQGDRTGTADPPQKAGAYSIADLPEEAQETLALIDKGGPFPYREDNTVFGNRERLLPAEPKGYYHEFTVATPGSDDRGARRLILGKAGETYYTSDHYASFHRVERNRQ